MVERCNMVGGWEIVEVYLIKRLIISMFYLLIVILISIGMFQNISPTNGAAVDDKYPVIKFIYMRMLPIVMIIGCLYYIHKPLFDIFDKNKYDYSTSGTLEAISSEGKFDLRDEYTIKLNGELYHVPNELLPYALLEKEAIYEVSFYNNTKLVYRINRIR